MSSLSTSLKNSYQKWLNPYEEYLKLAKPGVQQHREYEYGGPFTPSPANSPLKLPKQQTPSNFRGDSPANRASAALNLSLNESQAPEKPSPMAEQPRPAHSSGFTAVNSGGFTPVNLTPSSFHAVNTSAPAIKWEAANGNSTPPHSGDSSANTSKNTPEYQGSTLSVQPLSNGYSSNLLKRTASHDSINGGYSGNDSTANGDSESHNARRSKRQKKGVPNS